MKQEEIVRLAKDFLRNRDVGVLSTFHEIDGEQFPYGSLCPFISTLESKLVILISDIALHTKNINKVKRVGLTAFDMAAKNKQSSSRISIMGNISKIVPEEREDYESIKNRYLTFFPEAQHYFMAHDFNFFEITPLKIHFIQTFGKIFKILGDQFINEVPFSKEAEKFAIGHMNKDHQDSLSLLSSHLANKSGEKHEIVCLHKDGFHFKLDEEFIYLSFLRPISSDQEIRSAFVNLCNHAKEKGPSAIK